MSDDLPDLDLGLRELNSLLLAEETLASTLERVAAVATRCVTGGDGVSVTLVKNGSLYTAYASDSRIRAVDERQFELRAGPSVAAISTGEIQVSCDGDGAPEWSELHSYAAACGVLSFLAAPLLIAGKTVGSLNVFSEKPNAFGPDQVGATVLLASQAAINVANAKAHDECLMRIAQLQEALESRIVIEQAKGILMERDRLDADRAFQRLRERSQHANVKLRQVATEIIASVA